MKGAYSFQGYEICCLNCEWYAFVFLTDAELMAQRGSGVVRLHDETHRYGVQDRDDALVN